METTVNSTATEKSPYWFNGAHVINLTPEQVALVVKSPIANIFAVILGAVSIYASINLISLSPLDYFRVVSYGWGILWMIVLFVSYGVALNYGVKENSMDLTAFVLLCIMGKGNVDKHTRSRLAFKFVFDMIQLGLTFLPGLLFPEQLGMYSMVLGLVGFPLGEYVEKKYYGMNFQTYHKQIRHENNLLMAIGAICLASQIAFGFLSFKKYNEWYVSVTSMESFRNKVDVYFLDQPIDSLHLQWDVEDVIPETYGQIGLAATPEEDAMYYYTRFVAVGKFYIPAKKITVRTIKIALFTDYKLFNKTKIMDLVQNHRYSMTEGTIMRLSGAGQKLVQCDWILLYRKFPNSLDNSIRQDNKIFD